MRDARMFAIAGGTAQVLRTQVAGAILGTARRSRATASSSLAPANSRSDGAWGDERAPT